MSYNSTANEIAKDIGIKAATIKEWARRGYPIESPDGIRRVKLDGAQKIGKLWKFDKYRIMEFIKTENLCAFGKDSTNLKMEQSRPPRIGLMSSTSKMNAIKAQLMAAVSEAKNQQKMRPRV